MFTLSMAIARLFGFSFFFVYLFKSNVSDSGNPCSIIQAGMASSDGRVVNDPNDHSPAVHIVAWLGIVVSALAILARVGTKWIVQRKVEWDDGAIVAAFVGLYRATDCRQQKSKEP